MKSFILILSIGLAVASCGKKKEVAYIVKCQGQNMNYFSVTTSKMSQNYYGNSQSELEARVIGAKKDTIRVQLYTYDTWSGKITVYREDEQLGDSGYQDDPTLVVVTN